MVFVLTGEAQRRIQATAAIRLLSLCERAEEALATEEPEHEIALRFQRRLRKVLVKSDRRLVEALDNASRKERLAAFRAVALIGRSLDEGGTREQLDVAVHEAWDAFVVETKRLEDQLARSLQDRLEDASSELDRLESGPLANSLRGIAADLEATGFEELDSPDAAGGEGAKQLLDAAQRAAKLLRGARFAVRGKNVPVAVIAEVGLEAIQWHLDSKAAEAITAAKEDLRAGYAAKADEATGRWSDHVDQLRDETTRSALLRTEQVEQELFAGLSHLREDLQILARTRNRLTESIDLDE